MEYIQVQSETVGKTLKVKLNNSTITVLSKIFNLQPETIYLIGEDNVVMPDPETMLINEEDILSYVIYDCPDERTNIIFFQQIHGEMAPKIIVVTN